MTELIIDKVKFESKYKGAYSRIFKIINKERIFCEIYETDDSVGFENGKYQLKLSESLEENVLNQVLKIKNVKLFLNYENRKLY